MFQIEPGIFITTEDEAVKLDHTKYAFVSVAHTFHYRYLGWNRGENHQTDPRYILYEEEDLLSVNWIDGAKHMFDWKGGGVMVMRRIMDFILKQYLREKPVVIFCNQATSRAPTVALVFLSRRLHRINDYDFHAANIDFIQKYPKYNPGGIAEFVSDHWDDI